MNRRTSDRRRGTHEFWLRLLIPAALLVGLLVVLVGSVPREVVPTALVVAGAAGPTRPS
ncbi:hypothetical protein [Arthrobacter sp. L77]|uniref:hypothetical protein n=1 Tax=Arthrobacter sp. L77 TaxID=1496689 RepID=UPI000A65D487|nr:hypothetical protein [Arthrobacter sp. L77]